MERKDRHYKNAKRKLFGPIVEPRGFIFSHHLYRRSVSVSDDDKETKEHFVDSLSLALYFFWPGYRVEIHNNGDTIKKSFAAYEKKVNLIMELVEAGYQHLENGSGPLVVRDFLNDAEVNDGFGGTLFIHVDPDEKTNYCIFEISSCYKKYRYGTFPKEMKGYLRNLFDFLYLVKDDLAVIKEKIDEFLIPEEDSVFISQK